MSPALLLALALWAQPARAEYFTIESYGVDVTVQPNATLLVREHLAVNFTTPRHGIVRKVPFRYFRSDSAVGEGAERPFGTGPYYSTVVTGVSVKGAPFEVKKDGNYELIRIGDADRTVSGHQEYDIAFRVIGAVNFFRDHSELYWNAVGTEWEVPVLEAHYAVHLPKAVSLAEGDYKVFTGAYGSRLSNASIAFDGTSITGSLATPLKPYEGMTVLARFPAGYLHNGDFLTNLWLFLANNPLLPIPLLVFLACYLLWRWFGRDEQFATAVEWKLPPGLTPTEAGYLIDDTLDVSDLTAMILYWGANGHLRIEETTSKVLFFSSKDYVITRLKPLLPSAQQFERILFDGLFSGSANSVILSSLHNRFYLTLNSAQASFLGAKKTVLYRFGTQELGSLLKLLALVIPGAMVLGLMNGTGSIAADLVAIGATALTLYLFGRIMPGKTELGLRNYRAVVGFKEFVERVEKPRLEQILKEEPNYFDQMLSYAMVLGLSSRWAEKFAGLAVPPPTWYVGSDPFAPDRFVSHMNSGLSTMSSTMSSRPSQAGSGGSGFSGGGGGGSSGGGFGGGGGSSW